MHRDIAPRNLLIDPKTNKNLLSDFDYAANGKDGLLASRDDFYGVISTLTDHKRHTLYEY
ncbi:hypothetical protein N7508_000253 [Penicillium antarcticum]|uniref:uncharacterized protein n=1 Tax=Penicillium antarcticum TaxID=416450 RepID=UPI00239CCA46|nr:uncharacterized protein N7508_000253 [Penicillium antarcticum]KAJ5319970.1 hypothetical protein N7508_000253 [Penicillium antarcticum]